MIEMQRTAPSRILKQREIAAQGAAPAALSPIDASTARARAADVPPALPARASCVTKEARLVRGDGGANAVEVRCSCGEWTRVELQVGEGA